MISFLMNNIAPTNFKTKILCITLKIYMVLFKTSIKLNHKRNNEILSRRYLGLKILLNHQILCQKLKLKQIHVKITFDQVNNPTLYFKAQPFQPKSFKNIKFQNRCNFILEKLQLL